ncbi:MAG TPA: ribbon-helix-helix protein, CopG family [Desulfurococcales archaeon]|nr:ribbon-helix-helix protein, CopG family [Desulfurococcales archaeon]
MGRVVILSVKVPKEIVEEIDKLIKSGIFSSRSEAIRRAMALLIKEYSGSNIEV